MHVVVIDTTLTTPPTGGAHTFLVDLSDQLVNRGWKVSVVTQPGADNSISCALEKCGAEVRGDLWSARHLPEEKAPRLATWVNARKPDAYIVSASPDVGWLALPLLDNSIATLSIAHNDVNAFYEPLKHYGPFIDCAVGVSQTTYNKIIQNCSVPSQRARHIPYGVRALSSEQISLKTSAPEQPLKIGYVGRIVQEQKRVMDFVPLVAELAKRDVSFELKLIGDGPDRAELQNAFTKAGLTNYVEFLGWLTTARVKEELRGLDVFALLSDYEGLPVALLEAMAFGVAPVVTNTESGNTQLVRDGENGYVVAVGNIQAFSEHIESLARDRDTLKSIGRAAWQTSQEYSIEKMTDRYVAAMTETVQKVSLRRERDGLTANYPVMISCRSKYPFWLRKIKQGISSLAS
jgi:glycosyltransferase involved in cell wall biosynthesis